MDYITTISGIHFTPTAPRAEDIVIGDIAHSLSMLCRAGGHLPEFFSVAMHCLNCAREAEARGHSPRVRLACLLHDASEAYMADVTRPVKRNLPRYKAFEAVLQEAVYKKYLGAAPTPEEEALIDAVDDAQLYYEFRHFAKEWEFAEVPVLSAAPRYDHPGFAETKALFLEAYAHYAGAIQSAIGV